MHRLNDMSVANSQRSRTAHPPLGSLRGVLRDPVTQRESNTLLEDMSEKSVRSLIFVSLMAAAVLGLFALPGSPARAEPAHAIAMHGDPALPEDFPNFP